MQLLSNDDELAFLLHMHARVASLLDMALDPNVDYQALFEQIKTAPCKVSQVEKVNEVKGEPLRTRPHLIDRELERVYAAGTLEEIHAGRLVVSVPSMPFCSRASCPRHIVLAPLLRAALEEAGRNLQQLGVFKRVDMLLNELPEVCRHAALCSTTGDAGQRSIKMCKPLVLKHRGTFGIRDLVEGDEPDGCSLVLDLEEKNWYKVHAATYVQVGGWVPKAAAAPADRVDEMQSSPAFSPQSRDVLKSKTNVRITLGGGCGTHNSSSSFLSGGQFALCNSSLFRCCLYLQGNENTFEAGAGLHNITGRAEHL
eukprot:scaffold227991_cov19-Tisochrysis_lutea.AAC.1